MKINVIPKLNRPEETLIINFSENTLEITGKIRYGLMEEIKGLVEIFAIKRGVDVKYDLHDHREIKGEVKKHGTP